MRKINDLLLTSILCLFWSCSSDEPITDDTEVVNVRIDYSFCSGSTTRAYDDVYEDYYEKCILSKTHTPSNFNLIFTHTNKSSYTHTGSWENDNHLIIPVGEYKVTGISHPQKQIYVSDSVYMKFDTDLVITKNQEVITIPAQYDCYLLLFKADDINFIVYNSGYATDDDLMFFPDNGYCGIYVYNPNGASAGSSITVYKTNSTLDINLADERFVKGKYYYFNENTTSFFLDRMDNGFD